MPLYRLPMMIVDDSLPMAMLPCRSFLLQRMPQQARGAVDFSSLLFERDTYTFQGYRASALFVDDFITEAAGAAA